MKATFYNVIDSLSYVLGKSLWRMVAAETMNLLDNNSEATPQLLCDTLSDMPPCTATLIFDAYQAAKNESATLGITYGFEV